MATIVLSNKRDNFLNTLNGIWFVAWFALAAMYLAQFPLFKNLERSRYDTDLCSAYYVHLACNRRIFHYDRDNNSYLV
jgi:hypothetical protein